MSGKPWPEGVTQAIQQLDEMAEIERELTDLAPFVARDKILRERWPVVAQEHAKLLRSMDVSADQKGNYGWEGRFSWFLSEMRRQFAERRGRFL